MKYTIGEIAHKMKVNTSTLRFYDKNGLLPFVDRDVNGRRVFKDSDLNCLKTIGCLKKSGLAIKAIREFVSLSMKGDSTLIDRLEYLDQTEKNLQEKINSLQQELDYLKYKKWYYKTSIEAGTESIHYIKGTKLIRSDIHEKYKQSLGMNNQLT